jgi:hypothetical protein
MEKAVDVMLGEAVGPPMEDWFRRKGYLKTDELLRVTEMARASSKG